MGTLKQMLEASRSKSGQILNALSFPLPLSGVFPSAMSSEIEAWKLTERKKFCPSNLAFPVAEMRWGLAATAGSRHWIHIDSDGLGTFVDTQCGAKWWILFAPPAGQSKHWFGSVELYLNGFDTNGINGGRWDLGNSGDPPDQGGDLWIAEAVYLTPGMRL